MFNATYRYMKTLLDVYLATQTEPGKHIEVVMQKLRVQVAPDPPNH